MKTLKDLNPANPADGVYYDIPFDVYVVIDAENHSAIEQMRRSPAHYQAYREGELDRDSAALSDGRLIHLALLEPAKLLATVAVGPVNEKTGKCFGKDTKAWAEAEAANLGKTLITPDDKKMLIGISDSVKRSGLASRLLGHEGRCECVIVWTDPVTGLKCKGRMDKYVPGIIAADVKSARDASPRGFRKAAASYGYHRQDAWYTWGIDCLGDPEIPFTFIAVEKEPPFGIGLYTFNHGDPDRDIDRNRAALENRELLNKIAACKQTGSFPCYSPEIEVLELPEWAHEVVQV